MKKSIKYAFAALAGIALFAACSNEEESKSLTAPVLNTDMFVSVDGNAVTMSYTGTLATAYLWQLSTGDTYSTKEATATVSVKGDYTVKLGVSDGGDYLWSAEVPFTIETSDLAFLQEPFWKALCGGKEGYNKTWVLDDFTSAGGHFYHKYHNNTVVFYGAEAWGGSDWVAEMGHILTGDWAFGSNPAEEGSISFDGATGLAKLVLNGETIEGRFSVKEIADDGVLAYLSTAVTTPDDYAWGSSYYNVNFTDQDVRFPLDQGRVNDDQFADKIYNVNIMNITDKSLLVNVQRQTESGEASVCELLYAFVCEEEEYVYDDPDEFVVPDRPALSTLPLQDGTYTLAEFPEGSYYNWVDNAGFGDKWTNIETYQQNMAEWWCLGDPSTTWNSDSKTFTEAGQANWNAAYGAYTGQSIVVDGNNITVYYKCFNAWGDPQVTEDTIVTTFTQEAGVITLADTIKIYTPDAAIESNVLYILADVYTNGICIAVDDIDESNQSYQSKCQNWIPAKASYVGAISFADAAGWTFGIWGDGEGNAIVTGDGEYEAYIVAQDGMSAALTSVVFLIDIQNVYDKLAEGWSCTVTDIIVDGVSKSFDASKILYGDPESANNLRIEINNAFGNTAADPAIAASELSISQKLTVKFTLSGTGLN